MFKVFEFIFDFLYNLGGFILSFIVIAIFTFPIWIIPASIYNRAHSGEHLAVLFEIRDTLKDGSPEGDIRQLKIQAYNIHKNELGGRQWSSTQEWRDAKAAIRFIMNYGDVDILKHQCPECFNECGCFDSEPGLEIGDSNCIHYSFKECIRALSKSKEYQDGVIEY